jgi:hypothetical protein
MPEIIIPRFLYVGRKSNRCDELLNLLDKKCRPLYLSSSPKLRRGSLQEPLQEEMQRCYPKLKTVTMRRTTGIDTEKICRKRC